MRSLLVLGTVLAVAAVLLLAFPDRREPSLSAFWEFFIEMLAVMPAVLVIMGLFAVWIPKEMVLRYMGRGSGPRGMAITLVFGTLPTGPLYAAFPLTKGLIEKGASPANVFVFMAAWACVKIPQELVELQFLGVRFMLARLIVTIMVVLGMAAVFQWLFHDRRTIAREDV